MRRISNKLLNGFSALLLVGGVSASVLVANKQSNSTTSLIRETDVDGKGHTFSELFSEFDNANFFISNETLNFSGQKEFSSERFQDVELLGYEQLILENNISATYNFSYNQITSDVVLSTTLIIESDEIETDSLYGKAFMTGQNDMDVVFDVDGTDILLSQMEREFSDAENCGWFSWIVKAVVAVVVVAIVVVVLPIIIPVLTPMIVITTIAIGVILYNVVEDSIAWFNYQNNKTLAEIDGYINDQNDRSDWKIGVSNIAKSGCGPIAAYNVMHSVGKHQLFREVILEFELLGMNIALALLGSLPYFETYFDVAHSVTTTNCWDWDAVKNKVDSYNDCVFIIGYWNEGPENIGAGAHYNAISKEAIYDSNYEFIKYYRYTIYNNDYENGYEQVYFDMDMVFIQTVTVSDHFINLTGYVIQQQ